MSETHILDPGHKGEALETDWPLELSVDDLRRMVDGAMERVVAHLETLPEQPMSYTSGGEKLARSLREETLPEGATPFTELLATDYDQGLDKT